MKKYSAILLPVLLAAVLVAGCTSPTVVQGTVTSIDTASKSIVIRDECPPNAEITLSLDGAAVAAEPQVNDVVRASYATRDGRPSATRLMNMTKQKEVGAVGRPKTGKKCKIIN